MVSLNGVQPKDAGDLDTILDGTEIVVIQSPAGGVGSVDHTTTQAIADLGGGGGGGAVDSVDGQTGVVVLSGVYQPLDSDLTAIAALSTTSFGRALLALADAAAGRTAFGLGTVATHAHTEYDLAGAAAAAQAASQPLDSDLTAIAALTTTSYGRAFLALADAAAGRTALGLGTAATSASTDFQPIDSDLTAIAALTTTSFGRGLLALADAAALRSAAGLGTAATTAATDYQPIDSDLTAIAALTTTSFGRGLLALADAAAARSAIGLTAANVPFTPNGSIAATDVQAAIQEVRDEAGSGSLTDAVILAPATSVRNVIEGTADVTELTLKADTGQTAPIFVIEDEAGVPTVKAQPNGDFIVNLPDGDTTGKSLAVATGTVGASPAYASLFASKDTGAGSVANAQSALVVTEDDFSQGVNIYTFARRNYIEAGRYEAIWEAEFIGPLGSGEVGFVLQTGGTLDPLAQMFVQAQTGQTAPLVDLKDEDGNDIARTMPDGLFISNAQTLPDVADLNIGDHGSICDPTAATPSVTLFLKDDAGNLRTALVPLT